MQRSVYRLLVIVCLVGTLTSMHTSAPTIQAITVNRHRLRCIGIPSLLKPGTMRHNDAARWIAPHPALSLARREGNGTRFVSIAKGPDPEVVPDIAPQFVEAIWLQDEEDDDQYPE